MENPEGFTTMQLTVYTLYNGSNTTVTAQAPLSTGKSEKITLQTFE
jgi:hypothetical protein